jgi:dTDP-glucose pyrophosphorylase
MRPFRDHLIQRESCIKEALGLLNELSRDAILFVVDKDDTLIGSLTDGDVRRGLINGHSIDENIEIFIQENPKFISKGELDLEKVIQFRENNYRILPIVNAKKQVVNVINFSEIKSYLPIDAVIMAGGKGQRLLPMTEHTPKPMLKVGDKPIIEHNLDRLALYGIDDFWISINYLGEQIESYFGDGSNKNVHISYVKETKPLGTIGAVSQIQDFKHEYVLITNSDLLTNLDYELFFLDFLAQDADMSVVTVPYQVNIPYAVLETNEGRVLNFKEKPTYTYYSNGGVYLVKRSLFEHLPKADFFNATDLIYVLIQQGKKVYSYPLMGYWLDIGNPSDFERAQHDITKIKF